MTVTPHVTPDQDGLLKLGGATRNRVLAAILMGNFAVGVVFTLLSVARARIAEDLHTTPTLVLWAFTVPSLTSAILAPGIGRLGDLIGHRRVYRFGVVSGFASSLLVASSRNVGMLIGFRTVAAACTATMAPTSLALIFRTFERTERAKAMGYWSIVGAGSPVIGVLIGAPMVEHFGWRSLFLAQAPLYLIALALGRDIPETPRREVTRFDWPGALSLAVGALLVLLAVNRGPVWGWADNRIVGAFVLSPLVFALFAWIEHNSEHPLLTASLVKHRNVLAGIGAQMFAQFAYIGAGFFLVNDILQDRSRGFGLSLSHAGTATLARPIAFAVISPIGGYLARRLGERITASTGMALLALGIACMTRLRAHGPLLPLVVGIALLGLGMGLASPSLTTSVANAVPEASLGVISGAQQLLVQAASAVGTQVMVTIVAADQLGNDPHAYVPAFWVAVAFGIAATATALCIRRSSG
jgi:MFS family permease